MRPLRIAAAHSPISRDVRENGAGIRALLREAAEAGARLVQFPEGAASGYVKSEIKAWGEVDWEALRAELEQIAELAGELGLWVILGANHRLTGANRPHNSLYVIADTSELCGRYDKRFCSNTEINDWYSPGSDPLVFEVAGISFGCALCIEISFAGIFADYRRRGVQVVLVSSYSRDDMDAAKAQAHAALNNFWVSLSTPAHLAEPVASAIYGPDGTCVAQATAGAPSLAITEIDLEDERWHVPLKLARPWRERARAGEIYRERMVEDPRSRDRRSF